MTNTLQQRAAKVLALNTAGQLATACVNISRFDHTGIPHDAIVKADGAAA